MSRATTAIFQFSFSHLQTSVVYFNPVKAGFRCNLSYNVFSDSCTAGSGIWLPHWGFVLQAFFLSDVALRFVFVNVNVRSYLILVVSSNPDEFGTDLQSSCSQLGILRLQLQMSRVLVKKIVLSCCLFFLLTLRWRRHWPIIALETAFQVTEELLVQSWSKVSHNGFCVPSEVAS